MKIIICCQLKKMPVAVELPAFSDLSFWVTAGYYLLKFKV